MESTFSRFAVGGGVRASDLVPMQICTNWEKMWKTVNGFYNEEDRKFIRRSDWPCGFIED